MNKLTKVLLIFSLISLVVPLSLEASFTIPGHVYTLYQLEMVQRHARINNQPVAFVYSNRKTDCGLATAASKDIFNELKDYSVIVYVEKEEWSYIPAIVQQSINSPDSGQYIPKTVIVNSDLSKVILIIPYAEKEQRKKLIKQAQDMLSR